MIRVLWKLFMLERARNLQPRFKNAVELFFQAVASQVEAFIVFGSVARGLASPESDIDVCVIGEGVAERRFDFPPYRFEVHIYTRDSLAALSDLVALDAVLNGVVLAGGDFVFDVLRDLRWFPKSYLLYRLNKVRQFRELAAASRGEAKRYYTELADLGLKEIASVLFQGTTLSKPEARRGLLPDLSMVEASLAQAGDQIWLAWT
ncbi:MAG: nucleotidyltransferase domain-containing protein [Chloroflexota bacterium]